MKARAIIEEALTRAVAGISPDDAESIVLERPRDPAHGDISSPVAMALARVMRRNPFEIAEAIAGKIELPDGLVDSVEVLKPGFINFRLAGSALSETLLNIVDAGDDFGKSTIGAGRKLQVEYVSANPTGPLVIVSARAAAVGSVIVNLLNFAGFEAEGEYYVNDHGNQVNQLGASLRYRLRERFDLLEEGEELGAYPGEYLKDIAAQVDETQGREWAATGETARLGTFAAGVLLTGIRRDLESFGVHFNSFFLESTLHAGATEEVFEKLVASGNTFEEEGAVFFRSTARGDDKDRVLKKSDGESTYFLSDIAYHFDKLKRGFDPAIGLLGPDHHGHVPRMKAAMSVLGASENWLEIMLVGWVRLMENGKLISMSKRAGDFVAMRDLIEDVGADVAKYFFLMRRPHSPLDFDLTLARKHSDENPVYYVQYAHARISSVVRFAREKGTGWDRESIDLSRLKAPAERALMLQLSDFPTIIEGAALSREPNRLTNYAQELATSFHQFYHECRIVSEDAALSSARLLLAEATMQVLRNTLRLLGVSAPASM